MIGAPAAATAEPDTKAEAAKPWLVFFYADTVGACRRADGYLAQVLQRRQNHTTFRISRVDIQARPDLAERFAISTVPTLLLIADNRVQGRIERPSGCAAIKQVLDPWLQPARGPHRRSK